MGRDKAIENSNQIRLNKKGRSIRTGRAVRMSVIEVATGRLTTRGVITAAALLGLGGQAVAQQKKPREDRKPGTDPEPVSIKNPLVISNKGWYQNLLERYEATQSTLAQKIRDDGYDAIITKLENGETKLVLLLNGQLDEETRLLPEN